MKTLISYIVFILVTSAVYSQSERILLNPDGEGTPFEIIFIAGDAHNYPSFAVWAEEMDGAFIQTLFATQSVATGVYPFKPAGNLKWVKGPGKADRPAALPYWFHKRDGAKTSGAELPSPKNSVSDAYTGATPKADAHLQLKADEELPSKVRILVEVNQPWDVNKYWTNAKYENNTYLTSCQPALVYAVTIDYNHPMESYYLNPIGHSHPYGADGLLYTNLKTFTTALDIFSEIRIVQVKKSNN